MYAWYVTTVACRIRRQEMRDLRDLSLCYRKGRVIERRATHGRERTPPAWWWWGGGGGPRVASNVVRRILEKTLNNPKKALVQFGRVFLFIFIRRRLVMSLTALFCVVDSVVQGLDSEHESKLRGSNTVVQETARYFGRAAGSLLSYLLFFLMFGHADEKEE